MASIRVFFSRLWGLLRKDRADRELGDEISLHLDLLAEDYRRQGMSPQAAREAALREFGGVTQMREEYRTSAGLRFVETLGQDIRYSLRVYRRSPGFAAVVVLLLALGIGVNTAIFSALDAFLLRMLPVKESQSLFSMTWASREFPDAYLSDLEGRSQRDPATGLEIYYSFPYSAYKEFRDRNQVFSDTLAIAANHEEVNVGFNGHAVDAHLQSVSGNFFQTLAVLPAAGRLITPSDDQESVPAVAVLSHSFWQQKLGRDTSIVGKVIMINGSALTIVGVAPPEFYSIEPGYSPDLWVTLSWYAWDWERLGYLNQGVPLLKDDKCWWLEIVGRLRPGVSQAEVQAQMEILFDQRLAALTGTPQPKSKIPALGMSSLKQGIGSARTRATAPLFLLMAMVGLVLLIACANVAGLLLARATARRREIAIRLSLGAGRMRLVRQLLTESILLAVMGGVAGLLIALWLNSFIVALVSSGHPLAGLDLKLNAPVLIFTAAVSILSGILFGLAPAVRATRTDNMEALKQNTASGGQRFVLGSLLASAQVALCLLLLVAAGLFVRALQKLKAVEVGFDRQNLMQFAVRPGLNGYRDTRLTGYYDELQRRLRTVPGVRSVGFSQRGPIGGGTHTTVGLIPGFTPPGQRTRLWVHVVGPGYFETLGIASVRGRVIGFQDNQAAPHVIVVNQKLVHDCFNGQDPVGRRINFGSALKPEEFEIVGVVADVRYNKLRDDIPPTVYFPYQQRSDISNFMTFEVRAAGDPRALMNAVQAQSLALDKDVPVVEMRTQTEIIDQTLMLEQIIAILSTSFGLLALALACVGIYGTMAYAVVRRTSEIGIRMALGARRLAILNLVLLENFKVVAWGIAAGLPLTWVAARLLRSQLFQLVPYDPVIMLTVLLAIVLVTAAAGYLPARRAARVDPMVALRHE